MLFVCLRQSSSQITSDRTLATRTEDQNTNAFKNLKRDNGGLSTETGPIGFLNPVRDGGDFTPNFISE